MGHRIAKPRESTKQGKPIFTQNGIQITIGRIAEKMLELIVIGLFPLLLIIIICAIGYCWAEDTQARYW